MIRKTQIMVALVIAICVGGAFAQGTATSSNSKNDELTLKAKKLVDAGKYVEAFPLYQQITKQEVENGENFYYLGITALAMAQQNQPDSEKVKYIMLAYDSFLRAKKLGFSNSISESFLQMFKDGAFEGSNKPATEAEKELSEAETYFSQGNFDEAIVHYKKSLALDPKMYSAALFMGDAYFKKNDFENAESAYKKAIQIDPNKETAYRYSATPLMHQKKYDEALPRYVEAFIIAPYDRLAVSGLSDWGEVTGRRLGHPVINIPEFKMDSEGNSTFSPDPRSPGSAAWLAYMATRATWRNEKFKKEFPNEKGYRHTLREETEALHNTAKVVREMRDKKEDVADDLLILNKLDEEGLLEAYILLVKPDEGIAEDQFEYMKNNRDKLRKYVNEYVIGD
ncbi:MAG: tetratricopeptide repeat protein [Pyrinomonadaceae bacterium]